MKKLSDSILSVLLAKFPVLFRMWEGRAQILTFEDTYWAEPPEDPLSARVALVTTAGVHVTGDMPFDMKDRDGDPTYREIPADTAVSSLSITHDYYDTRDAELDPGVVFPLDVLLDMEKAGEVREVARRHFSFMGHVKGRHIGTLMRETAPEVATMLKEDGAGAVILSPA